MPKPMAADLVAMLDKTFVELKEIRRIVDVQQATLDIVAKDREVLGDIHELLVTNKAFMQEWTRQLEGRIKDVRVEVSKNTAIAEDTADEVATQIKESVKEVGIELKKLPLKHKAGKLVKLFRKGGKTHDSK